MTRKLSPVDVLTLFIFTLCVDTGWTTVITPLWKNLLIHHHSWGGYIEDHYSRYICSFRTLSTQLDENGVALVEFTAQHVAIEMEVSSLDDKVVFFKEMTTWNKTAHFRGHSNLQFKGTFDWDQLYYKYHGNISSTEAQNFGKVSLLPEGRPLTREKRNDSSKVGLYVGIPVALAIITISLGAFLLFWAVRKGYLRHVPWSYRSFRNSEESKRSDVDINLGKAPTADAVQIAEQPAVHI